MAGPGSPDNQPLKLAGYGLLGVAAIAAVVGLVSLASSGSEAAVDPALQAPPSSSVITPPPLTETTPAAPAPAAPAVPAPNQLAGPGTTAALPGAGLPESGGTGAKSRNVAKAPVRIYNNSTVSGLAERAADDMRDSGWSVGDVSNWPHSNIPSSTVYYRPDTNEQAAARNLASSFGLRAEPRFGGIKDASPGLIVIVTKDYQRR